MNIKEAAEKAGVSARTLRYYEEKGLICPKRALENGYRDYSEETIDCVKRIHAYRELHFSLDAIQRIMGADRSTRNEILQKQLEDLAKRRSEIDHRITLIKGIRMFGSGKIGEIDFTTLDAQMDAAQRRLDQNEEIKKQSAALAARGKEELDAIAEGLIEALVNVAKADEGGLGTKMCTLKNYIEDNFYPCTDEIMLVYARSFGGDGQLAQMLEDIAGAGSADRLRRRIEKWVADTQKKNPCM